MLNKLVDLLIVRKEYGRQKPQTPHQSGIAELTLDHADAVGTIQSSTVSELPPGSPEQARRPSPLALQPAGGGVGVGTASPDAKLHVSSGGGFHSPQVYIEQTTRYNFARLRFNSVMKARDGAKGPEAGPSQADPESYWDIAVGGRTNAMNFYGKTLANSRDGSGNLMTLTNDGNVGIGIESPKSPLHVNGKATVGVLEVTGGADLSEPFSVDESPRIEAGTVMAIDDLHPGALKISDAAYDRKAAGIVAGAGGLSPGLVLRQGSMPEAGTQVALAGRVYCKAEAVSGPIEPGDLLTTSTIPGHAMKAADRENCHGAILGKAMSRLKEGKGLVLVLVNLH
ncbi:MAG: hypothetical protein KKH28_07800 [Elusimicrobia bacterium]|nr:hypothetical protein [Elusimicrobiota bacterium]